MTLQKIEFEYDIPDGYRFVRYGKVINGQEYLNRDSDVMMWTFSFSSSYDFIIVEKIPEEESKKHRWHDLMIEFANDKTLKFEYRNTSNNTWHDAADNPSFFENVEYRIKPKTKTVRFRNYLKDDGYVGVANIKSNVPGFKEWLGDWQEIEI